MTRLFRQSACGFALLAILTTGASASVTPPARELVVSYSSATALRNAVDRSGATVIRRIPALRVAVLRTSSTGVDELPGIGYAEAPVPRYPLVEPALVPASVPGGAYEWQYAATHEDLVAAEVTAAAAKVTIAVVDSGADVNAPDLAAKAPKTWNIPRRSTDAGDTVGHGTFVSSLAAGATANGEGIAGFGGDAGLLVVKAGDAQVMSTDVAAAIVYAVDHGADVVNLSLGGPDTSQAERDAIEYAISRDVLLVAAAGNDGRPDVPVYPAAYLQPLGSNGVGGAGLSVAASDIASARAAFSNYGSYISLAAPGDDVFGAISADADPAVWPRVALPGSVAGSYGYASGTSFAAPQVAGAAALVWAANPLLAARDVAAVLKETASGGGTWRPSLGYGILDVAAAVTRARSIVISPPTVTLTATLKGRRVELSWNSSTAASYRLDVTRDGGRTQVLLGASSSTRTSALLSPGHTYSFAVTATTRYGVTFSSKPVVVRLPLSRVRLELRTSSFSIGPGKGATIQLIAAFIPREGGVSRGGRRIALESFNGRSWRRFTRMKTRANGVATWRGRLVRGAYILRARYAGAADVARATSATLRLRVS